MARAQGAHKYSGLYCTCCDDEDTSSDDMVGLDREDSKLLPELTVQIVSCAVSHIAPLHGGDLYPEERGGSNPPPMSQPNTFEGFLQKKTATNLSHAYIFCLMI